jgi:hypothetical protein
LSRVGKNSKTVNKKVPQKMICQNPDCDKSGKEQSSINFYNTNSQLLPKYPVCKSCVQKNIDINNMQSVFDILKDMNIAFVKDVWISACENSPDNPFGSYMRQMNSLPQYRGLTWGDSITESKDESFNINYMDIDFKITPEIVARWGQHSKEDYMKLEQFYWDMKERNRIETPQEEIYLKKLAIISTKLDNELAAGNYTQAKALGDLFSKYMADSQFRAIDKTEADKTGGIRTFGQAYAESESEDFIPPWEYYRKLKGISQDIVDKTIMHIENHTLRMNKINIMTEPPSNTPKLEEGEY